MLTQVLDEGAPAPLLGPVRVSTAAEEADRLITAVAVGEFLPGDRLPVERELARLLGVSRPTVREAISRLQAAGVVEIRRGRLGGTYVRDSWTEVCPPRPSAGRCCHGGRSSITAVSWEWRSSRS